MHDICLGMSGHFLMLLGGWAIIVMPVNERKRRIYQSKAIENSVCFYSVSDFSAYGYIFLKVHFLS